MVMSSGEKRQLQTRTPSIHCLNTMAQAARKSYFKSVILMACASLASTSSLLSFTATPAKADLWCWKWESNCKSDGRIGTSGNDILGIGGGDTIQKIGRAADAYYGTNGAISNSINRVYEPMKRPILDAVSDRVNSYVESQDSSTGLSGSYAPPTGGLIPPISLIR